MDAPAVNARDVGSRGNIAQMLLEQAHQVGALKRLLGLPIRHFGVDRNVKQSRALELVRDVRFNVRHADAQVFLLVGLHERLDFRVDDGLKFGVHSYQVVATSI